MRYVFTKILCSASYLSFLKIIGRIPNKPPIQYTAVFTGLSTRKFQCQEGFPRDNYRQLHFFQTFQKGEKNDSTRQWTTITDQPRWLDYKTFYALQQIRHINFEEGISKEEDHRDSGPGIHRWNNTVIARKCTKQKRQFTAWQDCDDFFHI